MQLKQAVQSKLLDVRFIAINLTLKVAKITIAPRGGAGGLTFFAPNEDRVDSGLYSRQFLESQMAVALGGRIAEAQSGLRRAAAEGEAGPAAVRAISQHLAKLRRTLTLVRNGAGLPEAAKASGVFWKNEREFLRQARAWSLETLDAVQPEVLAADRACKTTGSPDRLIAERLALTIAARARRMGL